MNSYLDLVTEYNRVHSKKSRVIVACIALAVCLVVAIFGMADIGIKFETQQLKKDYGSYHIMIKDVTNKDISTIENRVDIAYAGRLQEVEATEYKGKPFQIMGGDQEAAKQLGLSVSEGTYPASANEALIDCQALELFHLSIGGTIKMNLNETDKRDYKIVGVYNDFSSLKSTDSHALFLSRDGTKAIESTTSYNYYVTFKDGVNISKATHEIQKDLGITDKQISENTYLLTVMGQGRSNIASSMYLTATVLFALVLVASCVMITNSFNMNVLDRVKFFGMMRCLGASKKQVKKYVMREGLTLSLKAIPIGLITGSLVIEIVIILLRTLNKSLFVDMSIFQFSFIGIIAGIVVGFLTVILASLSPAKKASAVSPLSAVTGNLSLKEDSVGKNYVRITSMPIDISMGIHHALASKKSLFLMVSSFTISIVLFLGFSVFIDFSHNAAKPMLPSSADISILGTSVKSSPSELQLVENNLLDKIKSTAGVKQAYGRKLITLPASVSNGNNGDTYVISYEDLQFDWAKDKLIAGKIDTKALNTGKSVLVDVDSGLAVGDSITFNASNGKTSATVGGILSSIPFDARKKIVGKVIVSESLFTQMTGIKDYTIIDIQLNKNAPESVINELRKNLSSKLTLRDMRQGNLEAQNAFYTMAIFVYGFTVIIAIITMFNTINSMNISVTSRTNYYGMMRAIGTSSKQLKHMVIAEAATYAICGCFIGSSLGIMLHRLLFEKLVTSYFHIAWHIPMTMIVYIVMSILIITIISVVAPLKKITNLDITSIINAQ